MAGTVTIPAGGKLAAGGVVTGLVTGVVTGLVTGVVGGDGSPIS